MQVGPRILAGIQLEKAEVGTTSGPAWRLSLTFHGGHGDGGGIQYDGAGRDDRPETNDTSNRT